MPYVKAGVMWLVMLIAIAALGALRQGLLEPAVGELRAHQVGTLAACGVVLGLSAVFVRWSHVSVGQALRVGVFWLLACLLFEFGFFHFARGVPWAVLLRDYDIAWAELLPLGAVALPFALIYGISRFVRWPLLAERYPMLGEQPGPKLRLGYGVLRGWVGYNGGLVVSADDGGLYLSTMPILLSFCHAPVFIPWPEVVAIRPRTLWGRRLYELHLRQAPEVDLALRASTFDFVRAYAERARVPGDYTRRPK